MKHLVVLTVLIAVSDPARAQDPICIPPAEPLVPSDDATFGAYADLIAEDFERYFSEFSPYIACLDAARLQAFARAQDISAQHQVFWDRADKMGLTEEAAPDVE